VPFCVFHIVVIGESLDRVLAGGGITIRLSLTAMATGPGPAIVCALARSYGPRWIVVNLGA